MSALVRHPGLTPGSQTRRFVLPGDETDELPKHTLTFASRSTSVGIAWHNPGNQWCVLTKYRPREWMATQYVTLTTVACFLT